MHHRSSFLTLYPRDPRSGPGYSVPVHPHLTGPMRPTRRNSSISPQSGLYALPLLCVQLRRLGNPRVDPCFRWHTFSTCRPPRPREVHRLLAPSSFTDDAGLRHEVTVSALPTSPTLRFSWRVPFRGFTTVRLRYDLSSCSPSLSELTRFSPSQRGLLLPGFRRIGHPLRRRV